jgi:hypothetical protein
MGKRRDTGKNLWTMKAGDILESVVEPEFIIEVIDLEVKNKETFLGKVIQFPAKSNRWANTQTVGKTGRYLKRDFMPSIAGTRDARLDELFSNIRE